MKKFLPNTIKNPQVYTESLRQTRDKQSRSGFTLIELLVVITIISILAVVGIIAYSSASARGRDARRIQEITAIQTAMEKNFQPGATNPYTTLANSDFANNVVPVDPFTGTTNKCGASGAQQCDYCVVTTAGNYATCTAANVVSTSAPAAGKSYIVCANLETKAGFNGATYFCRSNAQ